MIAIDWGFAAGELLCVALVYWLCGGHAAWRRRRRDAFNHREHCGICGMPWNTRHHEHGRVCSLCYRVLSPKRYAIDNAAAERLLRAIFEDDEEWKRRKKP